VTIWDVARLTVHLKLGGASGASPRPPAPCARVNRAPLAALLPEIGVDGRRERLLKWLGHPGAG